MLEVWNLYIRCSRGPCHRATMAGQSVYRTTKRTPPKAAEPAAQLPVCSLPPLFNKSRKILDHGQGRGLRYGVSGRPYRGNTRSCKITRRIKWMTGLLKSAPASLRRPAQADHRSVSLVTHSELLPVPPRRSGSTARCLLTPPASQTLSSLLPEHLLLDREIVIHPDSAARAYRCLE